MCEFASLDSLMDECSRGLNLKIIHISFNRIGVDVPFICVCSGLHDLLSDKFSYVWWTRSVEPVNAIKEYIISRKCEIMYDSMASLFIIKCLFYPLYNPPPGVFIIGSMLSLSSAIGTVLSKRCGFESWEWLLHANVFGDWEFIFSKILLGRTNFGYWAFILSINLIVEG